MQHYDKEHICLLSTILLYSCNFVHYSIYTISILMPPLLFDDSRHPSHPNQAIIIIHCCYLLLLVRQTQSAEARSQGSFGNGESPSATGWQQGPGRASTPAQPQPGTRSESLPGTRAATRVPLLQFSFLGLLLLVEHYIAVAYNACATHDMMSANNRCCCVLDGQALAWLPASGLWHD